MWREQKGTHVVIALEGLSGVKDFMNPTNVTPKAACLAKTEREQEEDSNSLRTHLIELQDFLRDKTNCTVLQHGECEADDCTLDTTPTITLIIVSSDSDYYLLKSQCKTV